MNWWGHGASLTRRLRYRGYGGGGDVGRGSNGGGGGGNNVMQAKVGRGGGSWGGDGGGRCWQTHWNDAASSDADLRLLSATALQLQLKHADKVATVASQHDRTASLVRRTNV